MLCNSKLYASAWVAQTETGAHEAADSPISEIGWPRDDAMHRCDQAQQPQFKPAHS